MKDNTQIEKTGYNTFYTKKGIKVKIKVSRNAFYRKGSFIIRVTNEKTLERFYHSPKKGFNNVIEVIEFIINNTENENLKFKII